MIQSFRSKALEQYWINGVRKGINPAFLPKINRQLQALTAHLDRSAGTPVRDEAGGHHA